MWHDIRMLNMITRALLGVVALALLHAGYQWLARQPLFEIRVVQLTGTPSRPLNHVDGATVKNAALPRIRGNFFTVDLNAARRAFETVPWVERAAVRREWPNKLIVQVDEYVPLGTWGEEGRLLSVDGRIFTANLDEAEEEGELIALDGPDDSAKEVAARLADLRAWLAPVKLAPRELKLSDRYAWSAKLDNGIVLELGREQGRDALKARVDRFTSVYPQLAVRLPGRIESVDMRYPNGLALRARGLSLPPLARPTKT